MLLCLLTIQKSQSPNRSKELNHFFTKLYPLTLSFDEGEGKIRSFTVSTGFVKTPLASNQIPAQAKQRGISEEAVIKDVMMGKSRIKEMLSPIEVANLFIIGFPDILNISLVEICCLMAV
jgi:NAD(P)-dependent dehydrogenase (short-subunit alcohol dehydrogenase family)